MGKSKVIKSVDEFRQYLFRVNNDAAGRDFIKQARKNIQPGCRLAIFGRGSRKAAREVERKLGNKVYWNTFQSYLPLKYATILDVYLTIATPTDKELANYARPGDFRIYGPKNILKKNKKKYCSKCGSRVW